MFSIELSNITKQFENQVILKEFSYSFTSPNKYAVLGNNGSGKSTLVKILSGLLSPNKGQVKFSKDDTPLDINHVYQCINLASPWSELIEDFTLLEKLQFHFQFRKIKSGYHINDMIQKSGLENAKNKRIAQFSSGMKMRVKLILAFYTQAELVLLDEPTSNLDTQGKDWYMELANETLQNQLVIVASNHIKEEFSFCNHQIQL